MRLSRSGKRLKVTPWMILNYIVDKNPKPAVHVGWTIPKKVGTAVLRNKLKRWCREFFRKEELTPNQLIYLNIVIREQGDDFLKKLTFQEFEEPLARGWRNIRSARKKAFDSDRSRI